MIMGKYKITDSTTFQEEWQNTGVLFNCVTDKAYTINNTSTVIWKLLESGKEEQEIINIFAENGVPANQAQEAVSAFIKELKQHGFIIEI